MLSVKNLIRSLRPSRTVFLALLLPALAVARDPAAVTREAGDELAAEYSSCAAYYVLSSEGMRRANMGPEIDNAADNGRKLAEHAVVESAKLTSPEVAQARMSIAQQTMMRTMKFDYANLSLVAAEYAFKCKDLLEHPEQRLSERLAEKDKLPERRK